jgi:hypothetical protein
MKKAISALVAAGLLSVTVGATAPAVQAKTAVAVEVQAEHLTGLRPDGSTVIIRVKVVAEGTDLSSLVGEGREFGSGGAHQYWPATGSIDGNVVTLAGVVTDSNNPDLIGSPELVVADSSTGSITLTLGPLAGGRFAGATIVAAGVGRVRITTRS